MDSKVAGASMAALKGFAGVLDVTVPSGAHPLAVADALEAARDGGYRSVRVPLPFAPAAASALRGSRCTVASSCEDVVGLLGGRTLASVARQLLGSGLDELDIPVEAGALGDGAVALQLRQVCAVCHAHGALANAVVPTSGLTVECVRRAARAARGASADLMTLAAPSGEEVPVELVAAAVSEARGHLRIRVAGVVEGREAVERLLNLGVFAIELAA